MESCISISKYLFLFAVCCQIYDNTPPILRIERDWIIRENETVGSKIAQAFGDDGDGDHLTYSLQPASFFGSDKGMPFRIDPSTGTVYLNESVKGRVSDYTILLASIINKTLPKGRGLVRGMAIKNGIVSVTLLTFGPLLVSHYLLQYIPLIYLYTFPFEFSTVPNSILSHFLKACSRSPSPLSSSVSNLFSFTACFNFRNIKKSHGTSSGD